MLLEHMNEAVIISLVISGIFITLYRLMMEVKKGS